MNGIVGMMLANSNTSDVAEGLGFIKGANCTIADIVPVEIDGATGNEIIFEWTGTNGTVRRSTLRVMNGKNGVDGEDGKDGTGTGDDDPISEADILDICKLD